MKISVILAFFILAIIQWLIPGKLIRDKSQVLKKGVSYKFKTEPVDPSHPFKGKYISLNFAETTFTDKIKRQLRGYDPVFVILGIDAQGFAKVKNLSTEEPKTDSVYVKATVYYTSEAHDSITVHFEYPFDKFYMEEFKAPQAEIIYRESTRDSSNTTYALVKIYKGEAVIENVFINDIPIGALIK